MDQSGPKWPRVECGVLSRHIAYDQNLMIAYKSNTLFKHYLSRKCGRDAGVCWDLRLCFNRSLSACLGLAYGVYRTEPGPQEFKPVPFLLASIIRPASRRDKPQLEIHSGSHLKSELQSRSHSHFQFAADCILHL